MLKKCKVVMLPTNEKAKRGYILGKSIKELSDIKIGQLVNTFYIMFSYEYFQPQHLYFLSDEEIKEGDWCLNLITKTLLQVHLITEKMSDYEGEKMIVVKHEHFHHHLKNCKKIIATTDISLWEHDDRVPYPKTRPALPQPSQSFIEKYVEEYNKGNIITDVLVEYEPLGRMKSDGIETSITEILKVSKDNTITIKKLKDNYSREEVGIILEKYRKFAWTNGVSRMDLEKWIEKNL